MLSLPWLDSQFSFYVCLGGPKLRKWYGAPDLLPKDGSAVEEDNESSGILIPKLIGSLCKGLERISASPFDVQRWKKIGMLFW